MEFTLAQNKFAATQQLARSAKLPACSFHGLILSLADWTDGRTEDGRMGWIGWIGQMNRWMDGWTNGQECTVQKLVRDACLMEIIEPSAAETLGRRSISQFRPAKSGRWLCRAAATRRRYR